MGAMLGSLSLEVRSTTKERQFDSRSPTLKTLNFVFVFLASSLCLANRLRGSPQRINTCAPGFNLLFSSTDADVKAYMKEHLYLGITDAQVDSIADKYSEDPAAVERLSEPIHTMS